MKLAVSYFPSAQLLILKKLYRVCKVLSAVSNLHSSRSCMQQQPTDLAAISDNSHRQGHTAKYKYFQIALKIIFEKCNNKLSLFALSCCQYCFGMLPVWGPEIVSISWDQISDYYDYVPFHPNNKSIPLKTSLLI